MLLLRDQRARLQLSAGARHITQLEPIGDQPTMALKGKLDIGRLIGQSQQLRCDLQPLMESVRSPDHEPPSVEGKAQCGAIVDSARQRDGFPDQRIGSPSRATSTTPSPAGQVPGLEARSPLHSGDERVLQPCSPATGR